MKPISFASTGLVLFLSLGLSSTATGGEESVTPEGPIFTPPSFGGPVFVPPGAKPGLPGTGSAPELEEQMAAATQSFSEARYICARLPKDGYRIDCLADQLAQYAAAMPQTPEYAEVRQIVEQTATKLNRVAKRNASKTAPPARLREDRPVNPRRSSRPIVPVATESLETATAEANAILAEAETLLLRASERSQRRKVAFSQVAEVVGSSTVLLRSS
ncbi:hypothetical protein [Oceaniglobus trochenteri]|uniref:hypothetical protein n=1 Tax=Oceaniglobus trochenteri TaxID=2763260 RepID=UPI001CFFB6D1|nr:hypothetical protein [Oceaniglobus trochenteri]